MSLRIIRDDLFQLFHKFRALRAGADKAHVPFQYVYELWNLIYAGISEESPEFRYPRIIFCSPHCPSPFLRILAHRPELQQYEWFFFVADADLSEKHGAGGIEFDGKG